MINNKNNYKIQSESNLQSDIEKINEEIENKQNLSNETLEKFFNKRERNITLRTFQSIVSTGYRYDVWNENADKLNDPNNISENKQNFDLLAELLSKVAKVMPEEYLGHLDSQVDFILSQKEKNFYDHFIDKNIQFEKFWNN